MSVAVNDMLVQAPNGKHIVLFPFWPADEPASFRGLLAKGGFEVSASQSSAGVVGGVSVVALNTGNCTIKNPWPAHAPPPPPPPTPTSAAASSPPRRPARAAHARTHGRGGVVVVCGGAGPTPVTWSTDNAFFTFASPAGVNCTISPPPRDAA